MEQPTSQDHAARIGFAGRPRRRSWRRKAQEQRGRTIAVIEITPVPNVFDIGGLSSRAVARVSKDSVSSKLLSALVFELSQLSTDPD